jgi:uncharacterized protein
MNACRAPTAADLAKSIQHVLPTVQAAWMYGSAAKGEMRSDSDLDLAVFMPPTDATTRWEFIQKASELAAIWGREVDLVKFQAVSPVLQKEILTHGQQLFVHDPDCVANYSLFALSQYRDYVERFSDEFSRIAQSGKVFSS